jgi:sigma-B regulation protein RsbU (phosphoserine phosphatase)
MPPDDDTLEEHTVAFRHGENWPDTNPVQLVHLLLVLDENGPPRRVPLRPPPIVIGRQPPADIVLDGTTVSRRHCRFDLHDGKIRLTDLQSTNGTYVNGIRLTEPTVLEDGAAIEVGIWRLRYQCRAQDETADADALEEELMEASKYVASILPKPLLTGPVEARWFYQPSKRIGGDAFGYQMLDDRHFAFFLLDVSGHGTAAAMHAMSVAQIMRERVLPDVDFRDPAAVVSGLNARFQMTRNNDLFFTIWYGVYDKIERVLAFCAAGHHPAYLLPFDGRAWAPVPLDTQNPIVGMLPDPEVIAADVVVPPDSVLHLFSDGVFEVTDRSGRQLDLDDLLPMLPEGSADPRVIYDHVRSVSRPGQLDDDFSALVFRFP